MSDAEGLAEADHPVCMVTIEMPDKGHPLIAPLVYAVPVQLLAYHVAVVEGDRRRSAAQPREIGDGGVIGQTFIARSSPWRLALLALGAGAFVAAGLFLAGIFGPPPRPVVAQRLGDWLCGAYMPKGLCGVKVLRRPGSKARCRRPHVRRAESMNGAFAVGSGRSQWTAIIDVTIWVVSSARSRSFAIYRNPDRIPSTKLLGKLAGANRARTGGESPDQLDRHRRPFRRCVWRLSPASDRTTI
jgi:hypothetical protein